MTENPIVQFRNVSFAIGGAKILEDKSQDLWRRNARLARRIRLRQNDDIKAYQSLYEPTAGEVLVEGKSTTDWDAISLRRRIGYVLQEAGLFRIYGSKKCRACSRTRKLGRVGKRERTEEMLELVGLSPNKFAARFSARAFRRAKAKSRCGESFGGRSFAAFAR